MLQSQQLIEHGGASGLLVSRRRLSGFPASICAQKLPVITCSQLSLAEQHNSARRRQQTVIDKLLDPRRGLGHRKSDIGRNRDQRDGQAGGRFCIRKCCRKWPFSSCVSCAVISRAA